MRYNYVMAGLLLLMVSCKKDKDNSNQPDCQKNNYGTLKINFGATDTRHHIMVQYGWGYLEKNQAIGIASDTFHLSGGTWNVIISSTNELGGAIDMKSVTPIVAVCKETVESVPF